MAYSFNPMATTNARGSFSVTSDGYVQGAAMDHPSARNNLAGGVLAGTETLPMWGGCAIFENVSGGVVPTTGQDTLGGTVGRATSLANITGFSVFDQAHHMIQTPTSEVPSAQPNMSVHFYRLSGTGGARIPLQIDPAFATALNGGLIIQQVSWDFNLQRIVPYAPVAANENITGITWSGGVATVTTSAAHGYVVGDDVTIAGATPAAFNGDFAITTTPTATTFTYALATNPGTETVPGIVVAGGGLLPVKILNVNINNSKVVTYDTVNNLVHWNNAGSCALVLL